MRSQLLPGRYAMWASGAFVLALLAAVAILAAEAGRGGDARGAGTGATSAPLSGTPENNLLQRSREIAEGRAAAALHPHTKPTDTSYHGTPTYSPAAALPTPGILATRESLFPASEFQATNFYQGPANGNWYLIWAGTITSADGTPTGQGGIIVYSTDSSDTNPPTFVGKYTAPASIGTLTIQSYSGMRLSLADGSGHSIQFDLSTLAFG